MPVSVFPEYRVASRKKENFSAFYGALVLLSLHWAFILYINSSYLEQFVSGKIVGLLYVISALITISVFLYATHFLNAIGNYHFIVLLTVLEGAVLIGMAHAHTATWALPLFVLHQAIVPLILFCLDIFMEEMVGEEEQTTGGRRGLLLTIMSLMGALASLASGYIIGDGIPNFSFAYTISALLLIPFLLIIIGCFRKFVDPPYHNFDIIRGFTCFWSQSDMRNVFFAHFLLQLFFAWMVIYTPIYLATVVGFNWKEIGEILFGGLMAYVFLEYIIGVIADKWLGEKEKK